MRYDYIFCGYGLSAMVTLNEIMESGLVAEKKILILHDSSTKLEPKTWCFWDADSTWDAVVKKTWNQSLFVNCTDSIVFLNNKTKYKMMDAEKLYAFISDKAKRYPTIEFRSEKVITVNQDNGFALVTTVKEVYKSLAVFSSVYQHNPAINSERYPLLKQHFLGWYIKTTQAVFLDDTAVLMDFSIKQSNSTRFMYILPLSKKEALVEFTLFSPDLLNDSAYESELKKYLSHKKITDYEIVKTEKGIIPMTAFPFWKKNSSNILYIGSAGGWTKASTGYTFNIARNRAIELVSFLKKGKIDFRNFHKTSRFYWYDQLFIEVLYKQNGIGYRIFSGMFTQSNPKSVFRFLDEKSNFYEELKIILACPKKVFLKALWQLLTFRKL